MSYYPKPYLSSREVLAAQQVRHSGMVITYCDCLVLAPFPKSNGGIWISSPNVEFVPEIPVHAAHEPFGFFADGMLGPFEYLKWPQFFDDLEPHAVASPGNPDLMFSPSVQSLPLVDHRGVLPTFADASAPWFSFTSNDFTTSVHMPHEDVGFLSERVHVRLREAAEEAIEKALAFAEREFGPRNEATVEEERVYRGRNYVLRDVACLRRAISRLQETATSSFEVVMWFRDAQRLILALRAWLTYMSIIRPRLDDPSFADYENVLPLRGVVTRRETVVQTMFRCGIPVWWLRPLHTLSDQTLILSVRDALSSSIHFTSKRVTMHGKHRWEAPAWLEAKIHDNSVQGMGDMLRRYSLFSKPTVHRAVAVLAADRDQTPRNSTEVSQTVALERAGENPTPIDHEYAGYTDNIPSDTLPQSDPVVDGNVPESANEVHRDLIDEGPRKKRKGKPHRRADGDVALQMRKGAEGLQRPDWMSDVCAPWEAALDGAPELRVSDPSRAITYFLPPVHLFHSTGDTLGQKVHNWLRIREWSMFEGYASIDKAPVLMTTPQWRIALEGRYFAFQYPRNAVVQPESSLKDIASLPPAPTPPSTLGKHPHPQRAGERDASLASIPINPDRRRLKRLMERVDIHVRFGVHGRFPPYEPVMHPLPTWLGSPVDRERANTDAILWSGITWELSVTAFRLELLALDQELVPELYDVDTVDGAQPRQYDIMRIWNDACTVWERPGRDTEDWLTSPDWTKRRIGMAHFQTVMAAWPVAREALPRWQGRQTYVEGFEVVEREIALYYCRRFRSVRGRLPTLPLRRPNGLPPFRPSPP